MALFDDAWLERYSRQILLKEVGIEGQSKLAKARVLVIGAGGLGAPAAYYLAAAGVGTLGLVDGDRVDLSNLQRQILHFTPDIGKDKARSAAEKLSLLNPDVQLEPIVDRVVAANIRQLIRNYDFVIDGTDNFAAKFLINDACVMEKIPYSHGGILRFSGQTVTVFPGSSACYRCIFKAPPPANLVPSCSQAGILGAVAGILGTIQAAEALKAITGAGEPLKDALLTFDAAGMDFRKVKIQRDPNCAVCGDHPTLLQLTDGVAAVCDLRNPAPGGSRQ